MRLFAYASLALLFACTTASTSSEGDPTDPTGGASGQGGGSSGQGGDAAKPRKVCTRFAAEPSAWAVPDASFNRVNATYGQWLTMDLDGDGKVDLVRANDPDNDGKPYGAAAGKPHWQLFQGGAGGFAEPAEWAVPDSLFNRVNATYGQWLTMDLDGDGKLDLVRANDPDNDGKPYGAAAGKPHWQFFKGEKGGFAKAPTEWAVPDSLFNRVNATYGQWLTMDLDGDGKLDLVRANDPDNDGKPYGAAARKPHWQFFKGEKSGFAKAPTEWAVPDSLFNRVNATYGQWLTMDLDGDGKLDLVRANDPDNDGKPYGAAAGKPHWQFFKGENGGFAKAPAEWAVPDSLFNRVNATYGQWLTMDLDNDGKVDLVRANDPDNDGNAYGAKSGKPHWQVFKGGDTGFAKAPAEWPVPEASFNRVNATYGQWLTMDLDGDGCVDLVRANDPKNDGKAFSGPSWQRFGAE
jgi:antitoxin component of MazEF toxin-antitoxin module